MRSTVTRAAVAAGLTCALTLASPALAGAREHAPSPRFETLSAAALASVRSAAAARTVAAPAGAEFAIDAPPITAVGPPPVVESVSTGRTATLTGRHWKPGAAVVVTNTSLSSVAGDERAAAPWEGQENGSADDADLCAPEAVRGHLLRCDAAVAFDALAAAFQAALGRPLLLTDSYRTFDQQVAVKAAKPDLAAVPGRSNHGYGLAIDLAGGVGNPGTATQAWLDEHGAEYGWVLPPWARPDGSKPEPWHWEFAGGDTSPLTATVAADGTWALTVPHLRGGTNSLRVLVGDEEQVVDVTADTAL